MLEAVPGIRQLFPIQKHHEIRQNRIGIDAAGADLTHQIHTHGIAAEREERALAERKNAAIAPDQIDRQSEDRVTEIFSEQCHQIGGDVEVGGLRHREIEHRHGDRNGRQRDQENSRGAVERSDEDMRVHASTALPLSANRPRGRFCMNRMIRTRMAILPSTAPATGSRNLLAMPSVKAPTSVPHKLPTPPNTTTMKESMM